MRRDSVLYVVPVMPQTFGNGLAMRAAMVLGALARLFDVHLFVVPVGGDLGPPSDFVRSSTVRIGGLDLARNLDPLYGLIARVLDPDARARAELDYPKPYLSRFCTGDSAKYLLEWSSQFSVDAVHVMRLYLAPLAFPFLRRPHADRPLCVLDLDDDDVQTGQRLMRLHRELGNSQAAAVAAAEAQKYQAFADHYLDAFDRVIVCSEPDAVRLAERFPGARCALVPNGYRPVERIRRHRHRARRPGPLRLIFVGTFGYFPNLDAARFLCREVLPILRRLTDREIRIDLVGSGSTPAMAGSAERSEVKVHGFAENLEPLYSDADVAVVPMRAGGGTRIKILEAFTYGVPVVTTSLGAEGIDADDGVHLLFADDAEAFARACLRLKEAPELAARLAAQAAELLAARYTPARVDAALAEVYGAPSPLRPNVGRLDP
jgi:glycosyltransferase involved in cell wall biosynthesis